MKEYFVIAMFDHTGRKHLAGRGLAPDLSPKWTHDVLKAKEYLTYGAAETSMKEVALQYAAGTCAFAVQKIYKL